MKARLGLCTVIAIAALASGCGDSGSRSNKGGATTAGATTGTTTPATTATTPGPATTTPGTTFTGAGVPSLPSTVPPAQTPAPQASTPTPTTTTSPVPTPTTTTSPVPTPTTTTSPVPTPTTTTSPVPTPTTTTSPVPTPTTTTSPVPTPTTTTSPVPTPTTTGSPVPTPSPSTPNVGFTATGDLRTGRAEHTATLLLDTRVLVVGGRTSLRETSAEESAELFDIGTRSWTRVSSYLRLTTPSGGTYTTRRFGHTATLLAGGKVLIAGGYGTERTDANGDEIHEALGSAFLFDPALNTFTPTAGRLLKPRYGARAVRLKSGKVLIVGGYSATGRSTGATLRNTEVFDPATGLFTAGDSDVLDRVGHTLTVEQNDDVLAFGGLRERQTTSRAATTIGRWDDATSQFNRLTPTTPAAHHRIGHTAHKLDTGRILLVGGDDGFNGLAQLETYDRVANAFASAGSLSIARARHGAVLIDARRLLVVGGVKIDRSKGTREPIATGELVDVVAGTSTSYAQVRRRHGHTVTRLPNGWALTVGGWDDIPTMRTGSKSTSLFRAP